MSENVVSLKGDPIQSQKASQDVVDELEEWLQRAKAGEIAGIAIAAYYRDGASGHRMAGALSRSMIGQLFSLMQRITTFLNDD
jgi:hypothetical protein